MKWARRVLQHIPILLFVSMVTGWTRIGFKPFECIVLGMEFNLRILALLLPLIIFGVVVLTFRYGRVFCSWFCPTHLYLEGARALSLLRGRWSVLAKIGFPLLVSAFLALTLVTWFVPLADQLATWREEGMSSTLYTVTLSLLLLFLVHLGLLRWRFCVYICPYGILMRLFKTDTTPVMRFDAVSGRCINCRACDRVCPYELDVRRDGDGDMCSNCALCRDACTRVLGPERGVLSLMRGDS